jgi:hypothetical protein
MFADDNCPPHSPGGGSDIATNYYSLFENEPTPETSLEGNYKKMLAADFLFAVLDDYSAYDLYTKIPSSQSLAFVPAFVSVRSLPRQLIQARIRSAQGDQTRVCREDLAKLSLPDEDFDSFWKPMMTAYTYCRANPEASAECSNAIQLVTDSRGNLRKTKWSKKTIDMIGYLFLTSVLEVSGESERKKDTITEKFLEQQPYSSLSAIEGCLQWCKRRLLKKPQIPIEIREIQCGNAQYWWKEDLSLFCTLWQQLVLHGWPEWANLSDAQLGLSATELLVNISTMVTDFCREDKSNRSQNDTPTPRRQNTNDSTSPQTGRKVDFEMGNTMPSDNLINSAIHALAKLDKLTKTELLTKLIVNFTVLNRFTELTVGDKQFKSGMVRKTREFVENTLQLRPLNARLTNTYTNNDAVIQGDCIPFCGPQGGMNGIANLYVHPVNHSHSDRSVVMPLSQSVEPGAWSTDMPEFIKDFSGDDPCASTTHHEALGSTSLMESNMDFTSDYSWLGD